MLKINNNKGKKMKKVLYIVIALGMINTFAGAGWLNLSDEQCNRYAGDGDRKGVYRVSADRGCFSHYERAKKICRKAGGRVPTFNELKRVPQSCGVRVTKFGHNGNEMPRAYYNCIRQKGFIQKSYWTKTPSKKTPRYIITVNFSNSGESSNSPYGEKAHIRCIR